MITKVVLASKSIVRKKILRENGIDCDVMPANVDEEAVKKSLIKEGANPEIISKNLAELKANKISNKLNGKQHSLISSVCISKSGSMIWNYTDKAILTMKKMTIKELKIYLDKIKDEALYAYNVYQIEGEGRSLFSQIDGDEDTIMGLPIKKIKEYLKNL